MWIDRIIFSGNRSHCLGDVRHTLPAPARHRGHEPSLEQLCLGSILVFHRDYYLAGVDSDVHVWDVSGQATILRGPETTSQVAVWSSYWRFDFGTSWRCGNRILDSSVGEVPSADLDVLPADVAEEFACVAIRRILFLIIIIAVATAKLAAISLASRCGRQDGSNKLPVAIDASHTAVYCIRLVRSGYSGDGTAIGDCGVDHPGSVKQLVIDALQVWTRGMVMALDDLRPGPEEARREECFESI